MRQSFGSGHFFFETLVPFSHLFGAVCLLEEHNFGLLGDDFISAFSAMLCCDSGYVCCIGFPTFSQLKWTSDPQVDEPVGCIA